MTKKPVTKDAHEVKSEGISGNNGEIGVRTSVNWEGSEVEIESGKEFKAPEDDHIEQMIEELIDYNGSIGFALLCRTRLCIF